MSEEKNVPKLRFPGFTEPWEQRKLGEVATFINGRAYSQDELLDEGKYKVLRVGNFYTNDSWYYSDLELPDKFYAQEGDLLYTWSATFGPHIWHGNKVIYHYHIWKVELSDKLDKTFTLQLLEEDKANILANKNGSTMVHITKEGMEQKQISIPSSVQEQAQIGAYFEQLDNLITLHQRKLGHVKDLKKSMLQKMFPKNGELYPEVRFPGFTAAWEQRKLGEVFEQTANFVNPNEKEIELWSLTVEDGLTSKTERYNREFLVKKDNNFKEVRPGEIVYNPMNMTLGAVGYNGMAKSVAVSGYYTTMITKKGHDSYYINTWLKSPQAISLYKTFATGSLIEKQRVQFSTLSIIPATFPEYEEQAKIGQYFSNLDHLITLHQRELDHLQLLKKGMLQQMFV